MTWTEQEKKATQQWRKERKKSSWNSYGTDQLKKNLPLWNSDGREAKEHFLVMKWLRNRPIRSLPLLRVILETRQVSHYKNSVGVKYCWLRDVLPRLRWKMWKYILKNQVQIGFKWRIRFMNLREWNLEKNDGIEYWGRIKDWGKD